VEIQREKYLAESRKTVILFLAGTAIIILAAKLRMSIWIAQLPLKLADLRHTNIPPAAKLRMALWTTQPPSKLADLRHTIIPLAAKLRMTLWITRPPLKLADLRHTIIIGRKAKNALWTTQPPSKLADLRHKIIIIGRKVKNGPLDDPASFKVGRPAAHIHSYWSQS